MLRRATPEDIQALARLRGTAYRESPEQAAAWLREIVGLENVLLVEQVYPAAGRPVIDAMLAAVPVDCGRRRGVWFSGLITRPDLRDHTLMERLLANCQRAYGASGYEFFVTVPPSKAARDWFGQHEFQNLLPVRRLQKSIDKNLWAQASFDTMTIRHLQQACLHYQPRAIQLPESNMAGIVTQLYRRGLTLVCNQRGYGLYFTAADGTCLQFIELQAENDHSADILLEAARNQTGAERAELVLGGGQTLYLGQGKRFQYGMIRFLRKPFPVSDVYFRILI